MYGTYVTSIGTFEVVVKIMFVCGSYEPSFWSAVFGDGNMSVVASLGLKKF
jgi:hypothetical protein